MKNNRLENIKKRIINEGIISKNDFQFLKMYNVPIKKYEKSMGDNIVFEWKINDLLILKFVVMD